MTRAPDYRVHKTLGTPVASLATANGEDPLILSPRNRRLPSQGAIKDVVYVYRPRSSPSVAHLVIGSGGYRGLIEVANFGRGSNLVADWRLFEEVAAEEAAEGQRALAVLLLDDLLEEAQQAA